MKLKIIFLLAMTLFIGGCSSFSSLKEDGKDIANKIRVINSIELNTLIEALKKLRQSKILFISVANDYDILSDKFEMNRSDLMSNLDYHQISEYFRLSDNLFLELLQTIRDDADNNKKKIKNIASDVDKVISVISKIVPIPNIIVKEASSTIVGNLIDVSEKFKIYKTLRSSIKENQKRLKMSSLYSSQVFKRMLVDINQDIQIISKIAKKYFIFSKKNDFIESINKFKYQLIFNDINNLNIGELEQKAAKHYKAIYAFINIESRTKNIQIKDFNNILNTAKEVDAYLRSVNAVLSRLKMPI